jgi:exopolysaccharide production protein ExoY
LVFRLISGWQATKSHFGKNDQATRKTSLAAAPQGDTPTRSDGREQPRKWGWGIGREPTDELGMTPIGGRRKRLADLVVSGLGAVLLAPAFLAVALGIKLTMGGPAIYRHRRVGFGGRYFDCLKFRTMVTNGDEVLKRYLDANPAAAEEWRLNQKLVNDPRVTRLGWFLRKTSLDELPQLFNILKGEMSCVGPRPIVVAELERYGAHAHEYLRARPGVTGSWQVSGRSNTSYGERVRLDAEYVRKWSLWADLMIVIRTVPAILKVDQAA